MNDTRGVIQARTGSSRLPGKSLMTIWNGMTVLEMVLRRVLRAETLDGVVLATSDRPADDAVAATGERCGVAVFRGSESDVLGRFRGALDTFPATAVVRVCADNPLVDPQEIDRIVRLFWSSGCDYVSGCVPESGVPDGAGAEVLSASLLRTLDREAQIPAWREHVTSLIVEHPDRFAVGRLPAAPAIPDVRLDVDYPEDLEFVRAVCAALPAARGPYWTVEEIVAAARQVPVGSSRGKVGQHG